MHPSTARALAERPGRAFAVGALVAGSGAAAAAGAAADAAVELPPAAWVFLTVAYVGVAVTAYLAGRRRAAALPAPASPAFAPASGGPASGGPAAPPPGPALAAETPAPPSPLRRLAGLLAADPRPMLLLGVDAVSSERLLLHANAAALRLMGTDATAIGRAWAEVEPAAPAALRIALAEPGAGGPWWLLRDEGGSLCLALGPEGNGADADTASLVYTVSHDLRAPIRVVEGFTRIVKEDYGRQLDRVGNDHLDRVLAAGARMNQMIDAVLTMARLASQPLARQPVDLSQLAAFVADDLRRASPDRSVDLVIEPGLRTRGDPTLLRLVLENLLGNAWKYSSRNPQARVEFGSVAEATGPGQAPSGRRVFAVRDNGAGFDMRVADRLFGLFQRLHSAKDFPGTGVGLASVRRIVQRHGGEVWAESEPGRGASFFFSLVE